MEKRDWAGEIVDKQTIDKAEKLSLKVDDYLSCFNSYLFFEKTGDMIITGPTGTNVSDLMLLLTRKNE